jgi:hypothetical protein
MMKDVDRVVEILGLMAFGNVNMIWNFLTKTQRSTSVDVAHQLNFYIKWNL